MLRKLLPRRYKGNRKTPNLKLRVTIIVEQDGDGYYAYTPALKGLHVYDDTEEEAVQHAMQAIGVYLRSLVEHGDPWPIGPDLTVHEVPQEVPANSVTRNVMVSWSIAQMSGIN